jgi:hypothetical protein
MLGIFKYNQTTMEEVFKALEKFSSDFGGTKMAAPLQAAREIID